MRYALPLIVVAVCMLFAVLVFVYAFDFKSFSPFAQEVLAALIGVFLTVTITACLLQYQAQSEVNRDKTISVFQEKLRVYEGFCAFLSDACNEGTLSEGHEEGLKSWAMKLSLVCGREVADAIDQFFSDAAIEDFLVWPGNGLDEAQTAAGRRLVVRMASLIEETDAKEWMEPSYLIDDPRWKAIRAAADEFAKTL